MERKEKPKTKDRRQVDDEREELLKLTDQELLEQAHDQNRENAATARKRDGNKRRGARGARIHFRRKLYPGLYFDLDRSGGFLNHSLT